MKRDTVCSSSSDRHVQHTQRCVHACYCSTECKHPHPAPGPAPLQRTQTPALAPSTTSSPCRPCRLNPTSWRRSSLLQHSVVSRLEPRLLTPPLLCRLTSSNLPALAFLLRRPPPCGRSAPPRTLLLALRYARSLVSDDSLSLPVSLSHLPVFAPKFPVIAESQRDSSFADTVTIAQQYDTLILTPMHYF